MNIPCSQPTDINDNLPNPKLTEPDLAEVVNQQAEAINLALLQLKHGEPQRAMQTLEKAKL